MVLSHVASPRCHKESVDVKVSGSGMPIRCSMLVLLPNRRERAANQLQCHRDLIQLALSPARSAAGRVSGKVRSGGSWPLVSPDQVTQALVALRIEVPR